MTKQEMVDYIGTHFDWYEAMQMGLGHHSWWYTNRRPEQCINVKVYASVNSDKVLEKLSDRERQAIKVLGIDLDEALNDIVWSDYGLVDMGRDDLLEELKEYYNVTSVEYGGKSGGWLAVIYDWAKVWDDYEDASYTYADVRRFYTTIKNALAEHDKVTALILERKRDLERAIQDPDNYIEELQIRISDELESERLRASEVLAIS